MLALATLLPATLALAGWLTGRTTLASIDARFVPMAPNTALAFLVLGILQGVRLRGSRSRAAARALAGAVAVVALLRLVEFSVPFDLGVDGWWLLTPEGWLGGVPLGRMALPTAIGFLAAGATAALLSDPARGRLANDVAKALGVFVASVGLAFSLGYAYGAPLLYGGTAIPMALPTALAFVGMGASQALAALARDLADRREAQATLARAIADLESFNYTVSHDLRAPLRVLQGFAEAMLEDHGEKLDEGAREMAVRIARTAERMSMLIGEILAFARSGRQAMHLRRVDLSSLARAALEDLARRDPQRVVDVTIAPNLEVEGDEALLRVVLENLLGNAWKFTSRQPRARIEIGGKPVGSSEAGMRTFFVRDDGAGFEPASSGRLFQEFQRLHPTSLFEGIGLGLATARRIIDRHGGRVWAEGAPGKGATIWFTLPSTRELQRGGRPPRQR